MRMLLPTLVVAVLLVGCAATGAGSPPDTAPSARVDVIMRIIDRPNQDCRWSYKTLRHGQDGGQQCDGVGEAQGVACARGGDRIAWRFIGQNTTDNTDIRFPDAGDCVFQRGAPPRTQVCTLADPGRLEALQYSMTFTRADGSNCSASPYVIVQPR